MNRAVGVAGTHTEHTVNWNTANRVRSSSLSQSLACSRLWFISMWLWFRCANKFKTWLAFQSNAETICVLCHNLLHNNWYLRCHWFIFTWCWCGIFMTLLFALMKSTQTQAKYEFFRMVKKWIHMKLVRRVCICVWLKDSLVWFTPYGRDLFVNTFRSIFILSFSLCSFMWTIKLMIKR